MSLKQFRAYTCYICVVNIVLYDDLIPSHCSHRCLFMINFVQHAMKNDYITKNNKVDNVGYIQNRAVYISGPS